MKAAWMGISAPQNRKQLTCIAEQPELVAAYSQSARNSIPGHVPNSVNIHNTVHMQPVHNHVGASVVVWLTLEH